MPTLWSYLSIRDIFYGMLSDLQGPPGLLYYDTRGLHNHVPIAFTLQQRCRACVVPSLSGKVTRLTQGGYSSQQ